MLQADISDILDNNGGFDAEWYARTHADVPLSGIEPRAHFLRYGHAMGRGVDAARARSGDLGPLTAALARQPDISYCIPVMNRGDDIRGTLGENLRENAALADRIEFIVTFFDTDRDTHAWVRETFADEIASGYLRLVVSGALDSWHFGKAKNAFRTTARGGVYSSLDGDNFVTLEETRQLLEIQAAHPHGFVFHHFSGEWGDGSSGRVSLSMRLYTRVGYDELLLPRQYDEIDLILSCLARAPRAPLVRYDIPNHGLGSVRSADFIREARILNPVLCVPPVRRNTPLNPRGTGYLARTPGLLTMQDFNQAQCFMKNTSDPALRRKYLGMAVKARQRLVDEMEGAALVDTLFARAGRPEVRVASGAVCLFSCMKNDGEFLRAFHAHYTGLGAAHLFIVDDASDEPIADVLAAGNGTDNVHVFRPKTGSFATAKTLWLEALMKAHLAPGGWALTVDADEFLDLPGGFADLPALCAALERAGAEHAPGLLVDMLPGEAPGPAGPAEADGFMDRFDHHLALDTAPDPAYAEHHSVAWGFGEHARLSWSVDARYHAFGTFDSLRKIPLVQWRPGRHLNQGFHTLHYTDDTAQPGTEIWESEVVLPVRHYKLARLFTAAGREAQATRMQGAHGQSYHARTTGNITRIFSLSPQEALDRLLALPRRPYAGGRALRRHDATGFRAAPAGAAAE